MMKQEDPGRRLSQLDDDERYQVFDRLQQSMPAVWASMQRGFDDESVVVVPSISMDGPTSRSGTLMQAMEERALPPAVGDRGRQQAVGGGGIGDGEGGGHYVTVEYIGM